MKFVATLTLALCAHAAAGLVDVEAGAVCELMANSTRAAFCDSCAVGCGISCNAMTSPTMTYCDTAGTHVVRLDFPYNGISVVPDSIGCFTQLTQLNLLFGDFTALPETIGNLSNLTSLYLGASKVQLLSLPESITNLQKLRILYLDGHRLSAIPSDFGRLTSLMTLLLYSNELRALPESFGNLTLLQTLYLQNNRLLELPVSLGSLSRLLTLHFDNNVLTALPESFLGIASLSSLRLHNNFLNCSAIQESALPAIFKTTCNQSTQNSCFHFLDAATCHKYSPVCHWSYSDRKCLWGAPLDISTSGSSSVEVQVTISNVTDPTQVAQDVAEILGIDPQLVSVVVISPTEIVITIIGSDAESNAEMLVVAINTEGSSLLGELRRAENAHIIRKSADAGSGSSQDEINMAQAALSHAMATLFVAVVALY